MTTILLTTTIDGFPALPLINSGRTGRQAEVAITGGLLTNTVAHVLLELLGGKKCARTSNRC
jgi:hypothetical protein